jgi:hypothetical protein
MSKYRPYKDERNFNNIIIGAYQRNGTFLNVQFYRPIDDEEWFKAKYELCVLRARINARLTNDKLITGNINDTSGCLGSIDMRCVKNKTPLGITYEKVTITLDPSEFLKFGGDVADDSMHHTIEFDAVYLQMERTGHKFVIAKGESKYLKLVEITDMDENEIENITRWAESPIEEVKSLMFKRIDGHFYLEYNKETAPAAVAKQEKAIEDTSMGELVDKPYIVITPDEGVTELSSIIQCVHVQYRLYGTKNDNVEFTLHVTNPHTRDHKSVSFTISKRDTLIIDKHEMSFDECVCRVNTLLSINTLNRSVVDALFINTHGAFVIQFENGDCIDIDGAKECRIVEGWNNY